MGLCRLIYRSVATVDVVSNQTLSELERLASDFNAKHDITGLLVLSGNTFLQVLEGNSREITELFGHIQADQRHNQVELIMFEPAVDRLFDDWNMRLVDLYDLPGEKRALMSSKYEAEGGNILVPQNVHLVYAFLFDTKFFCLSAPWSDLRHSTPSNDELKTG